MSVDVTGAAGALSVGVIGCGAISDVYFSSIARSPALTLTGVAARGMDSATRQADRYGGVAMTVDRMLADPGIALIVNLTPSAEHAVLNRRILEAGKHLYTEKPFVLLPSDADALLELAEARGLRVGSAPDTFFGAAHQAARAAVDAGLIGRPVHGACFVGVPGIEFFHPNPAGFYRPGGEGPYEIGPYHITQLVNLLGPVADVVARSAKGSDTRTVRVGPKQGTAFDVEVPTTFSALLTFVGGAVMTLTFSLDVRRHDRPSMELYGTEGTLYLSDPNFFGDAPRLSRGGGDWEELPIADRPLGRDNRSGFRGERRADYRGIGLVEMAVAMRNGRPHRTAPALIRHCVEVMHAIIASAGGAGTVTIASRCERPTPFDAVRDADILAEMRSPWDDVPVTPHDEGQMR